MSSWPTGVDAIKRMLADGNLQKVSPAVLNGPLRAESPTSIRTNGASGFWSSTTTWNCHCPECVIFSGVVRIRP
jgi:hypothetical protein